MLKLLGNVIWFLLGGFFMALAWFLVGLLLLVSIIGIPFARAAFTLGEFSLWPFGKTVVRRDRLTGRQDFGTGPLGLVGNVVWLVFFGIWLAAGHVLSGVATALTIIGIPFAIQHFKLAAASLMPIGLDVVDNHLADRLP
ncbi:MAG: YccF domain-containing protein [Desulfovibrionaceae bacterium]